MNITAIRFRISLTVFLVSVLSFVTDRIDAAGNAIASVRPSVRLSVRLFPLYLRNRLPVNLELLHVSRS